MIGFPNAKINLGLNVVERRPDGFHNIETVFYPVHWKDGLEILPATETTFETSGLPIPGSSSDNLVLKAYHLLQPEFDLPPVQIHLHKVIPMGAGLGGGSADATVMLQLLNTQFDLGLTKEQLITYAAQIGSDCAFFVENQPVFATGKGDQMEKVELDLKGYYLQLIYPALHVHTGQAYQAITPGLPVQSLKTIIQQPIESWKADMVNDFEGPVFQMHPEIAAIKSKLYAAGAIYAAMSGSGSAVFGLFPPGSRYDGSGLGDYAAFGVEL